METHTPEDLNLFKNKALQWAASYETACYFDSNGYDDPYSSFDVLIAAGIATELEANSGTAFNKLHNLLRNNTDWFLGFMAYDLKNETENLSSSNPDGLGFPELYFFKPLHLIQIKNTDVRIISPHVEGLIKEIESQKLTDVQFSFSGRIESRFTEEEYKNTVSRIQDHIRRGDIYEVNFCQEFFSEDCEINPVQAFRLLNKISPTPFATFFKYKNQFIIGATPERFLSRRNNKVISQPIKGTIKRSAIPVEDEALKLSLRNNLKEQAENVMIVDLVRNDLTKCAIPGTVEVEELFGIYSFKQVHQMISTVICEVNTETNNAEIIKSVFPMGSMTGAPKISAMELIEKYERTKRGLFSGAVGYFAPGGDFDFNVIIRTLLYNSSSKYLSFQVGSAITFSSDRDNEYQECMLKSQAIIEMLGKQGR